jgi:site-specific DNA recombinase
MKNRQGDKPSKRHVRCAVYTRKSTEEGLDKEFNTLDAQRESAQAYIASQQHEGWIGVHDAYDDGGFTGGNMDRPALQRLLADIQAGKIDCVVVYKVDRLSRSLLDFAKMMELFDRHQVAFVSVTQQFNTATSMGRLVMNVLLSFAQFEREIISERTRDKIAAARRKGKWSGGHPILGYDVDPRTFKLMVNEAEAARVRDIFALYLRHETLAAVVGQLHNRGWTNKRWVTRKGRERGGRPFDRSSLYKLLTNIAYLGKVRYKREVHPGEHAAILDEALWQQVQESLRQNGRTPCALARNRFGALLKGLLYCGPCGSRLTPTHSTKNGRTCYRYYRCSNANRTGPRCPTQYLPAPQIEAFVIDQIRCIARDQTMLAPAARGGSDKANDATGAASLRCLFDDAWNTMPAHEQIRTLRRLIDRVDYDPTADNVSIHLLPQAVPLLVSAVTQNEEMP